MLATLGFGLALGLVNGILIGVARISFFVVTLGTLSIYASIALLMTSRRHDLALRQGELLDERLARERQRFRRPARSVLCACSTRSAPGCCRYTRFGRSVYAVGSNPEAARLAGLKVVLVLVSVYAISGLCAGIGAVVQTGRLAAARRRSTRR